MTEVLDKLKAIKDLGVKRYKCGELEVEFFAPVPPPMSFDPKELAKTLADSMPPDSAMLMASAEPLPGIDFPQEKPINPSEGNAPNDL